MSDPSRPKKPERHTPAGGTSPHCEKEADISGLGDAEIDREAKREAVRWTRGERRAAEGATEQQATRRSVETGEYVVLLGLLVFVVLLAAAVIVVGLLGHFDLVQLGIGPLCAASWGIFYRLGIRAK